MKDDFDFSSYVTAQEFERSRLAKELHDVSLQDVVMLIHKVELTQMYLDDDIEKARLELEGISDSLRTLVSKVRSVIYNLSTLNFEDMKVEILLEKLIERTKAVSNISFTCNLCDIDLENPEWNLYLYRTIQEILINISKHSKANNVVFSICKQSDNEYKIIISDDGIGFDYEKEVKEKASHYGLHIIKDRIKYIGGKLNLTTSPGNGTKYEFVVRKWVDSND